MFSRLGASLTGTADNCVPIELNDTKVAPELLTWILPTETPVMILHSLQKDFIWTDKALIVIIRFHATGSKRSVFRADYDQVEGTHTDVAFETAGTGITDLDCELKFSLGGQPMSIDITKSYVDTAKIYYLALVNLENAQRRNKRIMETTLGLMHGVTIREGAELGKMSNIVVDLMEKYAPESYKDVLTRVLANT